MKKNNKKYLFFDIDGTLVEAGTAKIADSTKQALYLAQKNGHEIFICSGRSKSKMPEGIKNFNFDGYVGVTGAYAEYKNKIILKEGFSINQTKHVIKVLNKYNIAYLADTYKETLISRKNFVAFIKRYCGKDAHYENVLDILMFDTPLLKSVMPILIDDDEKHYFKNHAQICSISFINSKIPIEKLQDKIGNGLNVEASSFSTDSHDTGEITLSHCTKSKGIDYMLKFIGGNKEDCIVFGDGPNDKDMFKYADTCVAMGNAIDEIKNMADYITDDVDKKGIPKALKHYNLI